MDPMAAPPEMDVAGTETTPDDRQDYYGITAQELDRAKTLWSEIGYTDLASRIRMGLYGRDFAALQLRVERWAAEQVQDESLLSEAAELSNRFRQERSIQYVLKKFMEESPINEDYLREAYNLRQSELVYPATREIAMILVREESPDAPSNSPPERIATALKRIQSGEPFSQVADEISEVTTPPHGYFGIVTESGGLQTAGFRMNDEIVREVFALKAGDVSHPLHVDQYWLLIQCLNAQPERQKSYDESKEEIRNYLLLELYWLKIERTLQAIQFYPGLAEESLGEWAIPALYHHLAAQQVQLMGRKLNPTEILQGLWRSYQQTEKLENEVRISWEKEQIRLAHLAQSIIPKIEIPPAEEAVPEVRTVTQPAGVFFIVDTGVACTFDEDGKPTYTPEGVATMQRFIHDVTAAFQLSVQKNQPLVEYAKKQGWNVKKLSEIEPVYREKFHQLIDDIPVGSFVQGLTNGPYVAIVLRREDSVTNVPLPQHEVALTRYRARLEYLYRNRVLDKATPPAPPPKSQQPQ